MGSTNFTEHFDIPLPLGSDKTTPMDYNQSMQAVDEALFSAQGDASDAKTGLSATNQKVAQNTQSINALAGRVTTVEGTVNSQSTAISNLTTKIEGVEQDSQDMICAYNQSSATASRNYTVGDYFIYNDILYKATQNIASGATIVPNTNCSATNVSTELKAQAEDITDVMAYLSDMLITRTKTSAQVSVNPGWTSTVNLTPDSVTGYTPIGVIGYNINAEQVIPRQVNTSGVYVYNTSSEAKQVTATVTYLYVKNLS